MGADTLLPSRKSKVSINLQTYVENLRVQQGKMPTSSGAHGNRTRKKRSKAGIAVKAGKQLQSKLSTLHVGKLQKITEEPEEQTKA
eukprot:8657990-Ditylum_brightwellii.AAC.1